ncbi:MAG: DUF3106 domain-containing protein [Cocleimonas sp.]|nr:DUF3106 domain-containing protein [Cocleimonas sp.]
MKKLISIIRWNFINGLICQQQKKASKKIKLDMIYRTLKFTLPVFILFLSLNVFAIPWVDLTVEEQKILKSYVKTWPSLSEDKQELLSDISQQWLQMTPIQRKRLKQRLKNWKKMKPEAQLRTKKWFQWYQQQPTKVKKRIQFSKKWFQALSLEEKKLVHLRWIHASKSKEYPLKPSLPLTASTK